MMKKIFVTILLLIFTHTSIVMATQDTELSAQEIQNLIQDAEQGNANSQMYLGALYRLGNGVEQDYKQSIKWFSKAANQGNADAQA